MLNVLPCIGYMCSVCGQHLCLREYEYINRNNCSGWCCGLWRGITCTLCLIYRKMYYTFRIRFSFSQSSLNIMYSFHVSIGCRDSGSSGFLISPSVLHLFEAVSEGQNHIHPNEKPLLICFSTSCLPIPFHQESIFLSLCCRGLMKLSGHTCALRKIPLLSLKLYYSAQGHDSQCF